MVESAIINTLLGGMIGTIAGLVPGSGLLVSLLLFYPYLINLELIELLCFYIGLANLAQYTGSITAIYFGIPGESNSLPAAIEGHALAKIGKTKEAIIGTALTSAVAATITVILLISLSPFYQSVFNIFYKSINQFFIFAIAILIFVILGKNKWWQNILLMTCGFVVGKIGFNDYTGEYFLTFDSLYLGSGVPFFPFVVGLLVVPQIFQKYKFLGVNHFDTRISKSVKLFFRNIHYTMIGTFTGIFLGLIPAISTVLSTNISHRIAKKLDQQHPSYRSLICAEASNNSAVLMTLLPLLVLGIPITGSEALLVSIMDRNLFILDWNVLVDQGAIGTLLISVCLATIFGLSVSWPLSNLLYRFFNFVKSYVNILIVLIMLGSIIYAGLLNSSVIYYIVVFFCSGILGFMFKKYDILPLIFLFLIQSRLESVIIIVYNLYM